MLVDCCFFNLTDVPYNMGERIIILRIHIVMEELVPSLWGNRIDYLQTKVCARIDISDLL